MLSKSILLGFLVLIGLSSTVKSQPKPFVPPDFKVPEKPETPHFRARMLTVNDVIKDYDAVMTSDDHLQKSYASTTWPTKFSGCGNRLL